jgi:hypothetical protein
MEAQTMIDFKKILVAGLLSVTFFAPNVNAAQPSSLKIGKFLMCSTASQVAEYLTMVHAEGKTGLEAQKATGGTVNGRDTCGVGQWLYQLVGQHSRFSVGNGNYAINEIVIVGYIVNGIAIKSQPIKQFGFGLISKTSKPAGFTI